MPSRHEQLVDVDDSDDDFGGDSGSDGEGSGARCRGPWPLLFISLAVVSACIVVKEVRRRLARPVGVASPWRTCGGLGRPGWPAPDLHLHFLYMAGQGLPHLDIWQRFFEGAPAGSFSMWVHCQSAELCRSALEAQNLTSYFTVVPTVFNAWCDDLVSPMVQLLTYAVNATGDKLAKFIFLSETNLPLKPFNVIRDELAKHPSASDFCIFPNVSWEYTADYSLYMVKASQWSVLALQDAQVLLDKLPDPSPDKAMDFPPINNLTCAEFNKGCKCPDEMFVFGNIFGLYNASLHHIRYPGVGKVKLVQKHPGFAWEQGCCRTWVMKGAGEIGQSFLDYERNVSQLGKLLTEMESDNASVLSAPITHVTESIYIIHALGPKGLRALRRSSFLFARKFDENGTFPGFSDVMFADDDDY